MQHKRRSRFVSNIMGDNLPLLLEQGFDRVGACEGERLADEQIRRGCPITILSRM